MILVPTEPAGPMPAGLWLVTLLTTPGTPLFAGLRDQNGGLSPLGQVVASIWVGLAFESSGLALGDFAVLPDGIRALLCVPWEGSVNAVGRLIDHFKAVVASTAHRAGLTLESVTWQNGFDGRLIQDPLELRACRTTLKASQCQA